MSEKLFYTMGEVTEMFDVNPSLLRYWESRFKQLQPKRNNKGNRLYRPEDVEFIKLLYHLLKERGMTIEGARKSLQERSADELSRESELFERLQYIRQLLVEVRETLMDDPDKTIAEEESENESENGAETRNETGNGNRNRNGNKSGNSSEPQPVAEAPAGEAPLGLIVEPEKPLPAPVPKPEPEPDYASMPALVRPTEPDPEVIVVTDADLAGEFPTAAAPGTPAGTPAETPANAPAEKPVDASVGQLAETPAESSELPELKRRRRGRKEDAEPEKELFAFYEQRLF